MPRAIAYLEFGGPEVLREIDLPDTDLGVGDVRVRVEAVGVNPIDIKLRAGLRASDPITSPRVPGADAAGTVIAVGDGVDGVRVGQQVAVFGASGTYTSALVVPAARAVPLPAGVDAAHGAALGIPAGTAYQAVRSLAVGAGDTLLVHGGSGAVGQLAVQFARIAGARVIATSSPARADRLRELGAEPVGYGDGLAERVRALAPEGVTVAIDCAGTDEALHVSIALVADRDRIATIVRGRDAVGLGIRGFSGGSPHPLTDEQLTWRAEAVPLSLALLSVGALSVEFGPRFPLAEAAAAQQALSTGTPGKILLLP